VDVSKEMELRWVPRTGPKVQENAGYTVHRMVQVLQFRVGYATDEAGGPSVSWLDWEDVPIVDEEVVRGQR